MKINSNPNGEIKIQKVDIKDQLADIMANGLVEDKFAPLRDQLTGWDLDSDVNVHSRGDV